MPDNFKRASWLELFYDLAFVALVAQLTYLASRHHDTVIDYANIFIVGYSIFLAWWMTTANRNLQEDEDSIDKILVQVQMVGAFLMSITMPGVFVGGYLGFFLSLAGVRFLQEIMLINMYYRHPEMRPQTYNIPQGFAVGGVLWAVSAFAGDPWHFLFASMALAVDMLTPLSTGKGNKIRYLNVYHLQERLGLFLMLVIGESMIVVALSTTATSLDFVTPSIVFSGLLLMIALWWFYFEHLDECGSGVRPKSLFIYLHSHALLFGSIVILSVAFKLFLQGAISMNAYYLFVAGVSAMVASLCSIRASHHGLDWQGSQFLLLIIILGVTVLWLGYSTEKYLESMFLVSTLFIVGAIVDRNTGFHYHQLNSRSKSVEKP